MIDVVKKGENETRYRCEECGLFYAREDTAKRCEAWCKEHKSCNLDIIKDAVPNS